MQQLLVPFTVWNLQLVQLISFVRYIDPLQLQFIKNVLQLLLLLPQLGIYFLFDVLAAQKVVVLHLLVREPQHLLRLLHVLLVLDARQLVRTLLRLLQSVHKLREDRMHVRMHKLNVAAHLRQNPLHLRLVQALELLRSSGLHYENGVENSIQMRVFHHERCNL